MWSDVRPAPAVVDGGVVPLRRGQVWVAEAPPSGRRRNVVLLLRDDDPPPDDVVMAAPALPGVHPGRGRVVLGEEDGLSPSTVHLGRLLAVERTHLLGNVTTLSRSRLAEIDRALCDVLGIGGSRSLPLTPISLPTASSPPTSLATSPGPPPLSAVPRPPAPPVEPPPSGSTPSELAVMGTPKPSMRLDEHPIAQLFGQFPPAVPAPPPPAPAGAAPAGAHPAPSLPAGTPNIGGGSPSVAAALPEVLEIVRRRLHWSAPRLEALVHQAAAEDRSLEWTAAAVRETAVRGVMQSTLDEIADEIESADLRGRASR